MDTNNFKNTYTAKSNMIRSFQRLIQGEADNTDWNKVLILLEEEKDFKDAVDSNLLFKFEAFKSNYQNEYNKIENAFLSKNLLQITEELQSSGISYHDNYFLQIRLFCSLDFILNSSTIDPNSTKNNIKELKNILSNANNGFTRDYGQELLSEIDVLAKIKSNKSLLNKEIPKTENNKKLTV